MRTFAALFLVLSIFVSSCTTVKDVNRSPSSLNGVLSCRRLIQYFQNKVQSNSSDDYIALLREYSTKFPDIDYEKKLLNDILSSKGFSRSVSRRIIKIDKELAIKIASKSREESEPVRGYRGLAIPSDGEQLTLLRDFQNSAYEGYHFGVDVNIAKIYALNGYGLHPLQSLDGVRGVMLELEVPSFAALEGRLGESYKQLSYEVSDDATVFIKRVGIQAGNTKQFKWFELDAAIKKGLIAID